MTTTRFFPMDFCRRTAWRLFCLVCAYGLCLLHGLAAEGNNDLKFEVQLIWGTNGQKPPGKHLKDVEPRITEALKGVFKWQNYFEVSRKRLDVPEKTTQQLKLSEKCEIKVTNLGNSSVQIQLLGEGKCVNTRKEPVTPGRLLTIAGEDKNDTAWFVVLKAR
jgi:hypothetical protein